MGAPDVSVGHQHNAINVRLRERKHQPADPAWGERVRRDTTCLRIDGQTSLKRRRQRRRGLRLDADDLHAAGVPGSDAADQPTSADGDEHGVEVGRLPGELHADRALAEQCLQLIVRMHRQGAARRPPRLAGGERVRVAFADNHQLRSVLVDPLGLRRGGDRRHEDLGAYAELSRGIRHRGAMIATGGSDHACIRKRPHEEIGKS